MGNPFALGDIQPGYNVLDIGSGAGFDLYIAKRLTGESGKVCGIDLIREMIDRARKSLADSGMNSIDVTHVSSEEIPYKDRTFGTVISNGVINLSPCKQEIFRVLKNGGKLQFIGCPKKIKLNMMPGKLQSQKNISEKDSL